MTDPNARQVGGEHYQKMIYQHWDWVCDIDLHYLLACATKYVARWRQKNGVQDLEKAIHYLDKAMERKVPDRHAYVGSEKYRRFYSQLPQEEEEITKHIIMGSYAGAQRRIRELIASCEDTPTPE